MVDRESRAALIELTRRFFCRRLSSRAYEELVYRHVDLFGEDEALWFVYMRVEMLFADRCGAIYIGFRQLSRARRREIVRCLLFLQSDLEYGWDEKAYPLKVFFRALTHLLTHGLPGAAMLDGLGNRKAYPFLNQDDLDAIRSRPRLLAG